MNLNSNEVLKIIQPYIQNNQLTRDDFEKNFAFLPDDEKNFISRHIERDLKILLVDEIKFFSEDEIDAAEDKKFIDYVLQKSQPFVENNQLTYDEFEKIFGHLEKIKQYTATNIFAALKIDWLMKKFLRLKKFLYL